MAGPAGGSFVQSASNVDFQQLRYFVAVAECLNFSRAAEQLYVTQPLLSRQISELEQTLGFSLLERSTKSVTLTAAGQMFLSEAKRLLEKERQIFSIVRHDQAPYPAKLVVGVDSICDRSLLAERCFQFRKKYPGLEFCFVQQRQPDLTNGVANRRLDAAITFNFADDMPEQEHIELKTDCLKLIGASSLKINNLKKLRWEMTCRPVLLPNRDSRILNAAKRVYAILNLTPRVLFFDSLEDMLLAVETQGGFTVLPDSYFKQHCGEGFVSFDFGCPRELELIWCMILNCQSSDSVTYSMLKQFADGNFDSQN